MMTSEDKWPIFTGTGTLFEVNDSRNIPKFMIDVGLGPSLYLLTLKAMFKLFLLLTIINFPIMWIYYSGEAKTDFFSSFSLGNLGQNDLICESENIAMNRNKIKL
jgi:hypothetical protein